MQFDDEAGPVRFSLFVVLDAEADEEVVRVPLDSPIPREPHDGRT